MKYWIWLSRIEGLGPIKTKELLKKYKTPEKIWELDKEQLLNITGIGEITAQQILNEEYRKNLDKYIEFMKKYDIGIITILDSDYPERLKNIYDPPIVLYYKGNKQLLNQENIIAMIGCRRVQ